MELIVTSKGIKTVCCGCLKKINMGDVKVINNKQYCPDCYPLVLRKKEEKND